MAIIGISGNPGAGKTTTGRIVAQKLGYEFFSTGDLRGQIATRHGMTIDELNRIGTEEIWTDKECDDLVTVMGNSRDNLVFDSWLAWFFIPRAIRIFLKVDPKIAAERVFKDQRPDERRVETPDELYAILMERVQVSRVRYQKWYGVDYLDLNHYQLVLDTSHPNRGANTVAEFILKFFLSEHPAVAIREKTGPHV